MTKAEIRRLVDAVIEAARKHGAAAVDVKIVGNEVTVHIPLIPSDKPVADAIITDDKDDWACE